MVCRGAQSFQPHYLVDNAHTGDRLERASPPVRLQRY